MAKDIKALELLQNEFSKMKGLPDPPDDVDKIEAFEKKWSQQLDGTLNLFDDIAAYTKAIYEQMETLRNLLNKSTEKVQKRILDIIDSFKWTDKQPAKSSSKPLRLIEKLQKLEQKKNRLEESIMQTQVMLNKIENLEIITREDVDALRGCIKQWMHVRDESYEDEKRRKEAEEKERREREEEERRRREEEEKRRQEEEKRRREEEERRKREEEERRKQEEEDRKREEEERKRREEEDRIRREEEEKRRKEEEERRKREEEQRRIEEERRRKEEERRRREEERRRELERKKKEEEDRKRRLDPNNWDALRYKRSDGEVDGARAGLCCVVSAIPGSVREEDLECLASDEVRDEDTAMGAGEIPASPVVSVISKTGTKALEAPMRVFVPYNAIDNDDEVVIKCSVNGGDWQEKNAIFQPGLLKDLKNVSLVATEVNDFEEAKFIVVARTRSEDIIVDKPGLVHQSSVDKKVKFIFPRDTFKRPTKVKIQIRQIHPEHLGLATQEYEICENTLSTSPLVTLTAEEGTEMDIDIDITRHAGSDSRLEKGRYHHVYRGKERQWHFADSGIKNRNQDVTITLPRGKDHYSVIELETRKEVQKDTVLLAAEEIYKHAYRSVVRLIARQRIDDQSILILQCLRRDQIMARLAELDRLGYSVGPDTSREFCLTDGQKLLVKCRGNIGMTTRSNKNIVSLTYHAYMDSAKQEVSLSVVDENKQRDNDTYLGLLLFETADNDKYKTKGELPITMPKIHQQRPRTARMRVRFQPYLSALCKYLGWRLTHDDEDTWVEILRYLGNKREMEAIHRRAKIQFEEDEKRKICQTVFENWMKSLHLEDDKVQLVLDALLRSGYKELATECRNFVKTHKVLFSERVITALSDNTNQDLDPLAKTLHLSSTEIKQCKAQQSDNQIHQAWSVWQQSDAVICRGPGAWKYCLQTMESVIGKDLLLDDLKMKLEQSGIKD